MSVLLLSDQHDGQLRVVKPFREDGVSSVASPLGLASPGGLAVDGSGSLVIADAGHDRLVAWDPWTGTWTAFGAGGAGEGQFSGPVAVAIDHDERIHVVDAGNFRIVRIDDLSGGGWVGYGTMGGPTAADPVAEGAFRSPVGIAVDALGRIVVTDPGAGRVVRVDDLDGRGWTVLPLPPGPEPSRPFGVAASPEWLAISDVANRAVHLFDLDGQLLGSLDGEEVGLAVPAYLASDGLDLVVADIAANALWRYRLTEGALVARGSVRGSSAAQIRPLFQELGGIASGGR